MAGTCTFSGSYYNPDPWANTPCGVELSVPEGCPVHLVTGAPIDPANVTTLRVVTSGTDTLTANTTTIVGTDVRTFQLPDEFSCDCSLTGVAISFKHVEVAVPAAVAGDTIHVWGTGYDSQIAITAAAACPTPDWPSDYQVALSCDRCPSDPNGDPVTGDDPNGDPDGGAAGCAVGGGSPLVVVLVAVLLVRPQRRWL